MLRRSTCSLVLLVSCASQQTAHAPKRAGTELATAALGHVAGAITNSCGEGVSGAAVAIGSRAQAGQRIAVTAERGYYKIDDLPPGHYELSVTYPDTAVETLGVEVVAGKLSGGFLAEKGSCRRTLDCRAVQRPLICFP